MLVYESISLQVCKNAFFCGMGMSKDDIIPGGMSKNGGKISPKKDGILNVHSWATLLSGSQASMVSPYPDLWGWDEDVAAVPGMGYFPPRVVRELEDLAQVTACTCTLYNLSHLSYFRIYCGRWEELLFQLHSLGKSL